MCGAPRGIKVALLDLQDHVEQPSVIHCFPMLQKLIQAYYDNVVRVQREAFVVTLTNI
jgi:hypothetical protein